MIKIDNGFFGHPENLGRECCFAVALINYFRLNNIKINENHLFEKHLSSPYTVPNGGVDLLLQPKQVIDKVHKHRHQSHKDEDDEYTIDPVCTSLHIIKKAQTFIVVR